MKLLLFFLLTSVEHKIDQILSVFENGTTEIQYCYIENIHDGRGYTAGKAGFTSATGDLYDFVVRYHDVNSGTALAKYIPELKNLSDHQSSDTNGLRGFMKAYRSECEREDFVKTQDQLVDDMYKSPAREYVKKLKLKTLLAYLIVYDTLIQQGDGDDPDSFSGVLKKMKRADGEISFLYSFLEAREGVLMNATDEATRVEWRKSVDRVHALRKILDQRNFELNDLTVEVWGESWKIQE